jgi:hypothetical protein
VRLHRRGRNNHNGKQVRTHQAGAARARSLAACEHGAPNPEEEAPIYEVSESARALAGDGATLVVGNFGGNSFFPGERRQVSITMSNSGSTTWTTGGSYMLHWVNGTFFGWGDTLVTTAVPPTGQNQFVFTLVAPTTPGVYSFKASMISYSAAGGAFFGQLVSTSVTVATTVTPQLDAALVSQNFPTGVSPGQSITATVVMQNKGTLTWPAGRQFLLYNRNNPVNAWGEVWVATATTVGPGAMATYKLQLKAPSTVPSAFLWQMYDSTVGFFGALVDVSTAQAGMHIVDSTYGPNCGVPLNGPNPCSNLTNCITNEPVGFGLSDMRAVCEGNTTGSCVYPPTSNILTRLGDPAFGCAKTYVTHYTCNGGAQKTTIVGAEAGFSTTTLTCP